MNTQIKAEITYGHTFDKAGNMLSPSDLLQARDKIVNLAIELFGGFTSLPTFGGWKSPEGSTVFEDGTCLLIITDANKRHEIEGFARFVRDQLRQQSVALTISPVEFTII